MHSWEATEFPGSPLTVRNANEARLVVACQGGRILDTRALGDQYQILAETMIGPTLFGFRLTYADPQGPVDFGPGKSEVLDPVELLLFAARVERELPSPLVPDRQTARRLRFAAAALREAAKFAGLRDPPPDCFKTPMARKFAEEQPERLRTSSLLQGSRRLEALAEAVDEPL